MINYKYQMLAGKKDNQTKDKNKDKDKSKQTKSKVPSKNGQPVGKKQAVDQPENQTLAQRWANGNFENPALQSKAPVKTNAPQLFPPQPLPKTEPEKLGPPMPKPMSANELHFFNILTGKAPLDSQVPAKPPVDYQASSLFKPILPTPIQGPQPFKSQFPDMPTDRKELIKRIKDAANHGNVALYNRAFGKLKEIGQLPEQTDLHKYYGIPGAPIDENSIPAYDGSGRTLEQEKQETWSSENPSSDPRWRFGNNTLDTTFQGMGYGAPGMRGKVQDPVENWLRNNQSRTGVNSYFFHGKAQEMRKQGKTSKDIIEYFQDPKNYKDLNEKSQALATVLSLIPIVGEYLGIAGKIDTFDQAGQQFEKRQKEGAGTIGALGSTALDIGKNFISPVTDLPEKLKDGDISQMGKVAATLNAASAAFGAVKHGQPVVEHIKPSSQTRLMFESPSKFAHYTRKIQDHALSNFGKGYVPTMTQQGLPTPGSTQSSKDPKTEFKQDKKPAWIDPFLAASARAHAQEKAAADAAATKKKAKKKGKGK